MGAYPKDSKPAHFLYCRTIRIANLWNQPRWPLADEWMKIMWHMNIILLFSHTEEHGSAICRVQMELDDIPLSEMSDSGRQLPHVLTSM